MHLKTMSENGKFLSSRRRFFFAFCVLTVLIFSIYSNTFNAPWHFDDEPNVVTNYPLHIKSLSWKEIKKTVQYEGKLYRPVACLSFSLNYYFGKLNVFGYHLVNIVIHVITAIFLYLFTYATLNLLCLRHRYGPKAHSIAMLASVLWATHPVQTQAITYIVQRMASMASMFYIMSLYFYVIYKTNRTGERWFFLLICMFTGLLAFGSKENTAMLPVTIILYEVVFFQELNFGQIKKRLIIYAFAISIPFLLVAIYRGPSFFLNLSAGYEIRNFTPIERLLTELRVVIYYISLLIYPGLSRLNVDHDFSVSHSLLNPPTTLFSMFLIFGLITFAMYIARKRPLISFCIIWYFLNLLIESTILGLELVFEHRLYLPSMTLFILLSIFFQWLLTRLRYKKKIYYILTGGIVLFLIFQGNGTYMRNAVWKDQLTLWADSVSKSPNKARTHNNLGKIYADRGEWKKAFVEFNEAVQIDGNYRDARVNLGLAFYNLGFDEKALEEYEKVLKVSPNFYKIYSNIAMVYMKKGDFKKAIELLEQAVRLNPHFIEAANNLGYAYIRVGSYHQAIGEFKRIIEIDPMYALAYHNLGRVYTHMKLYDKAIPWYRKAILLEPRLIKTYFSLADVYENLERRDQSIDILKEAIKTFPNLSLPHDRLGMVYHREGLVNEALVEFREALRLNQGSADSHYHLALLYIGEMKDNKKALYHLQKSLRLTQHKQKRQQIQDLINKIKNDTVEGRL